MFFPQQQLRKDTEKPEGHRAGQWVDGGELSNSTLRKSNGKSQITY